MVSEKLCPKCRTANDNAATVCRACGTALPVHASTARLTLPKRMTPTVDTSNFINTWLIPEGGVGIHIAGGLMPYYLPVQKELLLGREASDPRQPTSLDLSEQDGFEMGVSRRHAVVRQGKTQFEVVDLGSSNGTWLNGKQLLPHQPYPFASGSQIRLGRLQLFVYYVTPAPG